MISPVYTEMQPGDGMITGLDEDQMIVGMHQQKFIFQLLYKRYTA